MSLNRHEQLLFNYIQKHPEERHHWQGKVQTLVKTMADEPAAATVLEAELWRYYEERCRVAAPFLEYARRDGIRRISLRNLSEYLLRIWSPPRSKKLSAGGDAGAV